MVNEKERGVVELLGTDAFMPCLETFRPTFRPMYRGIGCFCGCEVGFALTSEQIDFLPDRDVSICLVRNKDY